MLNELLIAGGPVGPWQFCFSAFSLTTISLTVLKSLSFLGPMGERVGFGAFDLAIACDIRPFRQMPDEILPRILLMPNCRFELRGSLEHGCVEHLNTEHDTKY
jgi:hypothetical protein